MLESIKIWQHHGKQYIKDIDAAKPAGFKMGLPIISSYISVQEAERTAKICPTQAISAPEFSIDLGKCLFCGECERMLGSEKINFSNNTHIATNERQNLIVKSGQTDDINLNPDKIRKEIRQYFGKSLKLRQVSAGGDGANEWELNASSNPNFDMGRFGIDFVASPKHADGIVITGPISQNMSEALQICYDSISEPKIIILAGTDAISGGMYATSSAVNRTFLDKYPVDLYVPGNPVHPLTFINGILSLIKK
jgi:Ni,Fe-hydrogenase III small subunit